MSFEDRWRRRFADEFYGGGAGGSNPAGGMTQAFGQAIGTVGTGLTDWFGQLKGEDMMAMAQLNPDIAQMLTTSMDPQQALYNQTLQTTLDQTRSGEAARGLANTPIGQQGEASALQNFNIDWQNQQLQRQLAGIEGATGAYGGLIGAGAKAAETAETGLSGYTSAFQTASGAKTADLNRAAQEQEAAMSQIAGGAGALGSKAGGALK
jgi:hypothetical protein